MTRTETLLVIDQRPSSSLSPKLGSIRQHRWHLVLAAQTAIASITSLAYIGRKGFWIDEGYSFVAAHRPLSDLGRLIIHDENNMAPFYLALHFWSQLGRSETFLRVLSAIPAIIAVPVFAVLVDRLLGRRAAVIAGFGLALNTMAVTYAQELRSYSLVVLCVCASTLLFVEAVRRPRPSVFAAWALISGIGAYAHYFTVLVSVIQLLSLAFLPIGRSFFRRFLPAIAGYGLLILPIPIFITYRGTKQLYWLVRRPTLFDVTLLVRDFSGSAVLMLVMCALVIFCLVVAVRARPAWRSEQSWPIVLLVGWMIVPVVFTFVVSYIQPLWNTPYLIISLPPFVALAAGGLARLTSKPLLVVSTAVLSLALLFSLYNYYSQPLKRHQDWRAATAYIESHTQSPTPAVLFGYGRPVLAYYTWERELPAINDLTLAQGGMRGRIHGANVSMTMLRQRLNDTPQFWVVTHGRNGLSPSVVRLLASSGFRPESEQRFPSIRVFEYVRT